MATLSSQTLSPRPGVRIDPADDERVVRRCLVPLVASTQLDTKPSGVMPRNDLTAPQWRPSPTRMMLNAAVLTRTPSRSPSRERVQVCLGERERLRRPVDRRGAAAHDARRLDLELGDPQLRGHRYE